MHQKKESRLNLIKINLKNKPIESLLTVLRKDMQFPDFPEVATESRIKSELVHYLNHLLDHDLQRLLQGLYRMDVDENAVKQILETGNPDQMALNLADLIIKRQKQKLYYRQKYRDQ